MGLTDLCHAITVAHAGNAEGIAMPRIYTVTGVGSWLCQDRNTAGDVCMTESILSLRFRGKSEATTLGAEEIVDLLHSTNC